MPDDNNNKNSRAKIEANNRYSAKNYDRISLLIPKGQKDIIDAHAQKKGESRNAYVIRAINTQIKQEDEQE